MTRWFAGALALLAACIGSVEIDGPDAGGGDAPPIGLDVSRDASRSWSAPERLLALSSALDDRFPATTRGALVIYFTRTETIGPLLINVPYRSLRPSTDSDFAPAARMGMFGTVSIWDLELADDELEWFFWKGLGQLATSKRASISAPWSAPRDLGADGTSPTLSSDGLTLYFLDAAGGLNALTRLSDSAPWQAPIVVGWSAPFDVTSIDVSSDSLSLLITARHNEAAAGVYIASRSGRSESFGEPVRIEALQGPYRNARFSDGDAEIFVSAELGGSEEIFRSVLE